MLIPKPKPETPAEKFMEGYLIPAIDSPGSWILPSPAGWNVGQPIPTTNAYNPAQPVEPVNRRARTKSATRPRRLATRLTSSVDP